MQLKARFKMKEIRCLGIIGLQNQRAVSFTGGFKQLKKIDYNKIGINAATLNGAYAMGLEKEVGSITVGNRANLILTKEINSFPYLFYAFGTNHIDSVYINGEKQNE